MDHLSQDMTDNLINKKTDTSQENHIELNAMEIDSLGESVNISMGAAAKTLSTLLNVKVYITTPKVTVISSEKFEYISLFPAVGVQIKYIEGLSGFNFFVIKQDDVKKIVNIMTGNTSADNDDPFTEIHTSAIAEIMNQMMGSSSTALAAFFNRKINISTPECVLIDQNINAKSTLSLSGEIVVIKLKLTIGDMIDSELVNIMPIEFAKEIAENLINVQLPMQTKNVVGTDHENLKTVTNQPDVKASSQTNISNQGVIKTGQQEPNISTVKFANLNANNENSATLSNLNVIMDVPLEVAVQIGKASKQVKEIIEFTQGSIIELEKQAGDPVDILVNGELIARGDVVVIDDNFGVRITEIVNGVV
ncbi:MAG: flagellar motor switch phosphatase FliY [Oscillospiraceae bacterium]|nr:flagellar motor switch phosphatase FliY [Oscillospiraceae bacterium]